MSIINVSPLNSSAINSALTGSEEGVVDGIGLSDEAEGYVVSPIVDQIGVSDVVGSNVVLHGIIEDQIGLQDILTNVFNGEVSDAIGLSDEAVANIRVIESVIDQILLHDLADSRLRAIGMVVEAAGFSDEAKQYFAGFVSDSIGLSDDAASKVALIGAVAEAIGLDDAVAPYIRLYAQVEDSIGVADEIDSLVRLIGEATDEIVFSAIVQLPGLEFIAYVVNPKLLATTKYTNYPFNSFAELNGVYYGLTDSGLYQLNGPTDDGAPIEAIVKTGFTNLGSINRKNVPRVYLGHTSTGQLLLKTITSHSGQKVERWYKLIPTAGAYRESRVQLARGVQSTYWQFELLNIDGAGFALDSIKLLPVVFGRVIG